ncbi:hypothetical protein [Actinophytocola sp. NPDC049390]|uniref:hypothetical protein n=1 Tax=Actinophytocola sp. NPDC049390 TaxID=3363894 RepID=UPI00379EE816
MRRRIGALVVTVVSCVGLAGGATANAETRAANGTVLVFEHELAPTTRYENPSGCVKLPAAAHLLANRTDSEVRIYADPFCLTPSLTVLPGHGTHVPPATGSFSV